MPGPRHLSIFQAIDEDEDDGEEPSGGEVIRLNKWGRRKDVHHKDLHIPGTDPDELFDLATFYTRAVNSHDHSARLRLHLHPDLAAAVERYVRRDTNPYETLGSFARDWITKGLYLASKAETGAPDPIAARELAQYRLDHLEVIEEQEKKYIESARRVLANAQQARNVTKVGLVLEQARAYESDDPEIMRQLGELVDQYQRWVDEN